MRVLNSVSLDLLVASLPENQLVRLLATNMALDHLRKNPSENVDVQFFEMKARRAIRKKTGLTELESRILSMFSENS